jgi:hypothetical protein
MASTNVKTYSADLVALSIGGRPIDSGYADGEFVAIEPMADDFGSKVGADGEVARFRTNDRRATIKIKLMQTSQGNDTLSQLRALALTTPNGSDVGAFQLTDLSSGVVLARADKAWVKKAPNISRGREIVEYEWTLEAAHMNLDPSGNPSV